MLVTAYGGCGEPCPPGLATRPEGDALAEVAGGLARVSWRAAGPATVLVTEASVDQGIRLTPQSGPAAAAAIAFTLGHCGLLSGIDADRSWWDPVGAISDHPAAINSADGTLTFTGPASARFRTADGFEVALERHLGAKALPGCM